MCRLNSSRSLIRNVPIAIKPAERAVVVRAALGGLEYERQILIRREDVDRFVNEVKEVTVVVKPFRIAFHDPVERLAHRQII